MIGERVARRPRRITLRIADLVSGAGIKINLLIEPADFSLTPEEFAAKFVTPYCGKAMAAMREAHETEKRLTLQALTRDAGSQRRTDGHQDQNAGKENGC